MTDEFASVWKAAECLSGDTHVHEHSVYNASVYCPASEGAWRFSHPRDDLRVQAEKAGHPVFRPLLWTKEGTGVFYKLDSSIKGKCGRQREEMALNLMPFEGFNRVTPNKVQPE